MIESAYAQLSAVSYGVGDFVGSLAARRVTALRVMLLSYPIATVLLGLSALVAGGPIRPGAVLWGALFGVCQGLGMWWFYRAMADGPMSVVSPVAAVLNAAVPVVVGVALGERPGVLAAAGVVLAMVTVILVGQEAPADATSTAYRFTARVARLAVASGSIFGVAFVLIRQAPAECGLWPLLFARAAATVLVFGLAATSGNVGLPAGPPVRLAVAVAVLDTCANVTTLLALRVWLLSLSSIVISLYPVVTVALAMLVLRERVTRWQGIGMALAMLSVGMIAAG